MLGKVTTIRIGAACQPCMGREGLAALVMGEGVKGVGVGVGV